MLIAVLSCFILACFAPWLHRLGGRQSGWLLSVLPAALFVYFASLLPEVSQGGQLQFAYPWFPGLQIQLSFLVDGLSLLFALLITGIGFFILVYGGRYLEGHQSLGRFYIFLLGFMGSMLGLVLSDNLISLFVFWELTTVTSFMLIGFNHEQEDARKKAHQGLMVTVMGGLALMTGFIMLGLAAGSFELSTILASGTLTEHSLYLPMLLLILLGTFTKSAQTPFHFWLPNAMAAPTPVSAYLHSATMVKAGVYLMARLHPSLGGSEAWLLILSLFGAVTMVTGIFLASRATGVKRVLAYSTVMALGTLTMLLGLGTEKAALAAVTFLLAHALYKGALFMIAGILDHSAGVKDFRDASGLRASMPITTVVAILASLSLAGIIPLFGFVGKELLLEAVLTASIWQIGLTIATLVANIMVVLVAAIMALKPWFGPQIETPKKPHDPNVALLVGPALLAVLGLVFGLAPALAGNGILTAAASAVYGQPVTIGLSLWHGINLPLMLTISSLIFGLIMYRFWAGWRHITRFMQTAEKFGPEVIYERLMLGMTTFASWQTKTLQNGYLRNYLITTLGTVIIIVGWALLRVNQLELDINFSDIKVHEFAIVALLILSAIIAVMVRSFLAAVAMLGALGFGVALLYVFFSAVDVGITQVLVETITVLLLVLVLYRLPEFRSLSSSANRIRDAIIAGITGLLMTVLILAITSARQLEGISDYFLQNSGPLGHGRNVVNVILVDFRALDTLGEIFVLALVAIGVYAMIHLRTGALPVTNSDRRAAFTFRRSQKEKMKADEQAQKEGEAS
ncbi:putative monovalent cation/H+ antiporter subunit A [Alkalimonas collagenimarina]|uniref:Monovalent cation/H+ antiporter subunit A n=1 Tax=Alkalimonas collagenimarina TaxID=400390 RepID=A0ABT9GWV1_9GAMM|nr:putative monovalent cation/H+ antiporter subunit A [Alkalimonas collagenimarina]MDP4535165.1 putative monovalent cation/H+ antiporter subunit A [Alkalimonas collagenimarina]